MHPHGNEQVGTSLFPQVAVYLRKDFVIVRAKQKMNNMISCFVTKHKKGVLCYQKSLSNSFKVYTTKSNKFKELQNAISCLTSST
jgi:hypothetical protein